MGRHCLPAVILILALFAACSDNQEPGGIWILNDCGPEVATWGPFWIEIDNLEDYSNYYFLGTDLFIPGDYADPTLLRLRTPNDCYATMAVGGSTWRASYYWNAGLLKPYLEEIP